MFEDRVLKGIQLLDTKIPGWRELVDFDKLDLLNANMCILGQVYGDFGQGVYELEIPWVEVSNYGFDLFPGERECVPGDVGLYTPLTDCWQRMAKDITFTTLKGQ